MPYRSQYDNAFGGGGDLQQRVSLAIVAKALAVCAEANPAPARKALAVAVLNDPSAYITRFLYVAALGGQQTDAGVDTSVSNAWDKIAGV
jgi:hypothetical protein